MSRIVPWLLVVLLAAAFARACTTGAELAEQLDAVRDTARVGTVQATASLQSAAALRAVVDARGDTITGLRLVRDSLRKRLATRVSAIPIAPPTPPAAGCEPWADRSVALAAALVEAEQVIRADSGVIAKQERSLGDLRVANDTLTTALTTARDRLARIDSMTPDPEVVIPARTAVAAFGELSVGGAGMRAEAGLQWKDVALSVEQSGGGSSLRLGVRKTIRLF